MTPSEFRSPGSTREGAAPPSPEASAAGAPAPQADAPAAAEIELKVLADPVDLARLMGAPPVLAHARNKGRVRHLTSVYYDTEEGALERAGVAFRVRNVGRRFVATVKRKLGAGRNPLLREEWEAPTAGMAPDPSPLLPLLPADLRVLLTDAPLRPAFTTTVRRHTQRLVLPDAALEIAFDQGYIEAGERKAPISEIELELKQGRPSALYELALGLAETAPLRPSLASKAERGNALARDRLLPGRRAPRLALSAALSLDDALSAILRSIFTHLLANQEAAEDGRDPEGVHQMRVALRRLRAALAQIRPLAASPALEALRADARWLASSFSAARNWDVFLLDLLPAVQSACPALGGFPELAEALGERRAAAYAAAHEALAAARVGRFELALGLWIEQRGWHAGALSETLEMLAAPALAFACPLLARRHRKVMKAGRHFARLTPEARHLLRLAVKKLRYSGDFFLPLEPGGKSARRYVRRLSRLQDLLGTYNDMMVTAERPVELAGCSLSPAAEAALGAVVGWQARGLLQIEADLRTAWRDFHRTEPPWSAWLTAAGAPPA